jgi:hypothetical protein
MMKKLACMLGRHQWTTHVEGGQSFTVCAVCGKTLPDLPAPGPEKRVGDPLGPPFDAPAP